MCGLVACLFQTLSFSHLGSTSKKPVAIAPDKQSRCKKISRHFVSDSEDSDCELAIHDIRKKRAVVTLTPLNHKMLGRKTLQCKGWPRRTEQGCTNEDDDRMSSVGAPASYKYTLRSQAAGRQSQRVTQVSPKSEEGESSEEVPCIQRKAKPSFKREASASKFTSDKREEGDVRKLSSGPKRMENPVVPLSWSRQTTVARSDQNGELARKPSGGSLASPDCATGSPGPSLPSRHRSLSASQKPPKYIIESVSESDTHIGEFQLEDKVMDWTFLKGSNQIPKSTKSPTVAGRITGRRPAWIDGVGLDNAEKDWTEKELQRLHRQVTQLALNTSVIQWCVVWPENTIYFLI